MLFYLKQLWILNITFSFSNWCGLDFFFGGGGVKVFGNKIVGEIGSIIQNTYNKQEMQKQKKLDHRTRKAETN